MTKDDEVYLGPSRRPWSGGHTGTSDESSREERVAGRGVRMRRTLRAAFFPREVRVDRRTSEIQRRDKGDDG